MVARSGPRPQRSRAAAAYFSAGLAERTLPARTITVELATDDTSEDGPTDRAPRTGAPVTVEGSGATPQPCPVGIQAAKAASFAIRPC